MTEAIGERLPDLLPDRESFEANRASTEASILGFAQILEQGADPAAASLGAATLAYTQEGAQRGIPLTTLIRSYRLGHAAAWEGSAALIAAHAGDPDQRAIATELCSAWLFAYVDAALCLAEDFYSAERERWVRSTAATRAETIDTILAGAPIDTALASRRLGYELDRQHTAVIAWLPAHEEGRDTHAAMEAAIAAIRDRLGATRALVHPLGILSIAAWISTHDAVSLPPAGRPPLRHAGRAGRSGSRPANPGTASRASARATTRPYRPAASRSSPPDRPGTITRYGRVALAAMATADLDQARTFVAARAPRPGRRRRSHYQAHGHAAHLPRRALQPQPHRQTARDPREHCQLPDQAGRGDPRAQRRPAHARAPRRPRSRPPRRRQGQLTEAPRSRRRARQIGPAPIPTFKVAGAL